MGVDVPRYLEQRGELVAERDGFARELSLANEKCRSLESDKQALQVCVSPNRFGYPWAPL